jgi:hypothetical protein
VFTVRQVLFIAASVVALSLPTAATAQTFLKDQPQRVTVAVESRAKTVSVGVPFELAVRITPHPGIHVYAPGNPDTIPVAIELAAMAELTVGKPIFAEGKDFVFEPTQEVVKVYSEPFNVRLPAKLEGHPGKGRWSRRTITLNVRGRLSYQACDDRVCFPPQSTTFDTRLQLRLDRP